MGRAGGELAEGLLSERSSPPSRGGHMRGSYSRPGADGGGGGGRTLGTFSGVYIPCVNSIFGVVLFLRWGWAVGQIGISGALAVLLLGTLISFITAAHVSALATNGEVETGGAYFLLSRALGPEFGGAVGFLFYVAQAFAVGLYTLGFTEAMLPLLEASPVMSRVLPCTYWTGPACSGNGFLYANEEAVSSVLMLFLLAINMLGTHWFARVSKLIFLGVLFGVLSGLGSIIAYSVTYDEIEDLLPPNNVTGFVGISWSRLRTNWAQELVCEQADCVGVLSTFYVVGVILPAVTGLLNGASMSGDLKDPGHSIPAGTLYAVITMVVVYSSVIVLQGAAFERSALRSNYNILQQITFFPPIVLIATVFATVSPALTTMAGMSRILQAQAKDEMYGKRISPILSKGFGPRNEPRWCFVLSWFLGQLVCLFGEVNLAATFVTVFFFTTYGALNFACAVLIISGAPNFRPEFKWYSSPISLVGTVLCVLVGFVVDTRIASISLVLAFVVFFVLSVSRAGKEIHFAEVSQALIYQFSHRYLLTLDLRKAHPKFWRPQVLVLLEGGSAQEESLELCNVAPIVGLAHQLRSASSGLLVVGQVLEGVVASANAATLPEEEERPATIDSNTVAAATEALVEVVENALGKNIAFATVTVARNFIDGMLGLMLGGGLGPIRPNTLVMAFPSVANEPQGTSPRISTSTSLEPPPGLEVWAGTVRAAAALGRTVVATRGFQIGGFAPEANDSASDVNNDDAVDSSSFANGLERFRSSVSTIMPARGPGLLLPGGARLGGDHIPRIVEEIFPRGQGGPPLLDFRVDMAGHGPRAGLTVDVWVLDGWGAASALRATGQLDEQDPGPLYASGSLSGEQMERMRKLSVGAVNSDDENIGHNVSDDNNNFMFTGPHAAWMLWESFQARTLVLLQLGFLLHLDPFWLRYTRLRVLVLVPPAPSVEREWLLKRIAEMMRGARISADLVPVDAAVEDALGGAAAPNIKRATAVNTVVRSVSNNRAGMILLQAGAINPPVTAAGPGCGPVATPDVSVEAASGLAGTATEPDLDFWQYMEALSSGLNAPSMLVFANDEQVTTEQL